LLKKRRASRKKTEAMKEIVEQSNDESASRITNNNFTASFDA
jgi:hypothetical protein